MQIKRIIARIVLCALFAFGVPVMSPEVNAETIDGSLLRDQIEVGDTVYFGQTDGEAIAWIVLNKSGNQAESYESDSGEVHADDALFLLSEYVLSDPMKFKSDYDNFDYGWKDSHVQRWCSEFVGSAFTEDEQKAILMTSKKDKKMNDPTDWSGIGYWEATELNRDKVFFPSVSEVLEYLPEEQYKATNMKGEDARWWLRTPTDNFDDGIINAAFIDETGEGYDYSMDGGESNCARPAMNLNIASISDVTKTGDNEWTLKAEKEKAAESGKKDEVKKTTQITKFAVSGNTYKVLSSKSKTVALAKAKNVKNVTIPATVKYKGVSYKVIQVNTRAFTGKKIRSVTLGAKVKTVKSGAFKGSKAVNVTVKTKLLSKPSVKGALKGSKVTTIKVSIGSKKVNKKYVKKYKAFFTKKNAGKKTKVK